MRFKHNLAKLAGILHGYCRKIMFLVHTAWKFDLFVHFQEDFSNEEIIEIPLDQLDKAEQHENILKTSCFFNNFFILSCVRSFMMKFEEK